MKVTDILNKSLQHEESKATHEKLKGRFKLQINNGLPMHKKIETYANEKIAFHLHKNRNFIHKLKASMAEVERLKQKELEEQREQAKMEKIREDAARMLHEQERDLQLLRDKQKAFEDQQQQENEEYD